MKKKLALILSVVVLAALAIGGTTYALFTDTASNNESTFIAGTLDIDTNRGAWGTVPGPMFYTTKEEGRTAGWGSDGLKPIGEWAPGDLNVRSLIVYNDGSLDAVVDKVKVNVKNDDKGIAEDMIVKIYKVERRFLDDDFPDVPGDSTVPSKLFDKLAQAATNAFIKATGFSDIAQVLLEARLTSEPIWEGKLSDLTGEFVDLGDNSVLIRSGEGDWPLDSRGCLLAFAVEMDINAGNDRQGAQASFDFVIHASNAVND